MFVPFTYSALWIYFCIYSKKNNKKVLCKKNILLLVITLLVPFFLGYIYHIEPVIYNIFNYDAFKDSLGHLAQILDGGFNAYGFIYINYYSNFILLIPLCVYYFVRKLKQKELSFEMILFILLLLFIEVLITGKLFGKVSTYYIMKNYYILWLAMFFINFKALMYLYDKDKRIPYVIAIFYVSIIIINLVFVHTSIEQDEEKKYESPLNFVEIFGANKTIIKDEIVDMRYRRN